MPVAQSLIGGFNAGTNFATLQQSRRRDAFNMQQNQVENYNSIVGELGTTLKTAKEQFEAKLSTTSDLLGKQKILGEWKKFYEGAINNASRAGQKAVSRGIPVDPVAQVSRLTPFENLRDLAAETALEIAKKGDIAGAESGAKQEFNDFVRMENSSGQAIAVRKGDTPPKGFVPVSSSKSKQNIETNDLTKPNETEQQGIEIDATRSALEARELADKITAKDVGLRGIGNVALAVTIGQLFDSAVDKDVLNNRQKALAIKEKTLKSMSDDKRFSNLDREAISKLFVDMGIFESVTSARTKLLGLADILEQRAAFSAGRLGHKPVHLLRQDEIVNGIKDGTIDFDTGRRALINYHGFGE